MNIADKQKRLKKYKAIATGLFLLMAIVFILTFIFPVTAATGYIRAFSEAAMVGALADWFAVTALFKHPMGIPIPHTNLIEGNKKNIGQNLGGFITENFLSADNIKPRIKTLTVAKKIGDWLSEAQNQEKLCKETVEIISNGLEEIKYETITTYLTEQLQSLANNENVKSYTARALRSFTEKEEYEKLITFLGQKGADFILSKEDLIKEKIRAESNSLIPDFINDMIAVKVTKALHALLMDIAHNPEHQQRKEIKEKILLTIDSIETSAEWETRIQWIMNSLLSEENRAAISSRIWTEIKNMLQQDIQKSDSKLKEFIKNYIAATAQNLLEPTEKNKKLDHFIHIEIFKFIMRHQKDISGLISSTVENWESRSLSNKLELEVGKDLQFIRVNGTLVGGLVGLTIYLLLQIFT